MTAKDRFSQVLMDAYKASKCTIQDFARSIGLKEVELHSYMAKKVIPTNEIYFSLQTKIPALTPELWNELNNIKITSKSESESESVQKSELEQEWDDYTFLYELYKIASSQAQADIKHYIENNKEAAETSKDIADDGISGNLSLTQALYKVSLIEGQGEVFSDTESYFYTLVKALRLLAAQDDTNARCILSILTSGYANGHFNGMKLQYV